MAEGYINVDHVEDLTVTLEEGFTKESWGYIAARKYGNLIVVDGSGISANSAITGLTYFATISGITLTTTTNCVGKAGTTPISLQLHAGSTNKIRISVCPANTNIDFCAVGFCR